MAANGKIFYTSFTSLSHMSKCQGVDIAEFLDQYEDLWPE